MVKTKNTNRKKLIKKLDAVVTLILKERDQVCVVCGSNKQLGTGHIFTRRALSTRWDVNEDGNCHLQCWGCNYRHVHDQYPYFKWYIDKFGQDAFDNLRARHKTIRKVTDAELEDVLESLKSLSSRF